uniref:DOC domain-containing protein n=1 Tax=Anser cygnoides TaxID=8845 RepID=A0A8B9EUM7_ANSCY
VDLTYSLRLGAKPKPMEQDEAAVERLRYELFRSACMLQLWVGASHRLSLAAQTAISCQLGNFNVSCLTDSHADTYWESDGSQGQHWVRLNMKKGTIALQPLLPCSPCPSSPALALGLKGT